MVSLILCIQSHLIVGQCDPRVCAAVYSEVGIGSSACQHNPGTVPWRGVIRVRRSKEFVATLCERQYDDVNRFRKAIT